MKQANVKQQPERGKPDKEKEQVQRHQMDEKASIGGDFNSGVTSDDPDEKEQIEKQASLGKSQPKSQKEKEEGEHGLTKEDLPDATNESTGKVGSGLRQDSN
jgi:hypothetical protein